MQRGLLSVVILVLASCRVEAGCIDPTTLAHSTVGITRYFDDKEREAQPDLMGIRGTGWFLSPTALATAGHVTASMNLSEQNWKPIEIWTGENKRSIPVRITRLAGSHAEKISVLELQTAFPGALGLPLRMEPLRPEEPVVSLGYPDNRPRTAAGRFVKYGDGERFAGTALLELYDGNDRLVLGHGASGAPVFDCTGRTVAVVSNLFTSTMRFMASAIRVSTAWGYPNIVSMPAQVLKDFSHVD